MKLLLSLPGCAFLGVLSVLPSVFAVQAENNQQPGILSTPQSQPQDPNPVSVPVAEQPSPQTSIEQRKRLSRKTYREIQNWAQEKLKQNAQRTSKINRLRKNPPDIPTPEQWAQVYGENFIVRKTAYDAFVKSFVVDPKDPTKSIINNSPVKYLLLMGEQLKGIQQDYQLMADVLAEQTGDQAWITLSSSMDKAIALLTNDRALGGPNPDYPNTPLFDNGGTLSLVYGMEATGIEKTVESLFPATPVEGDPDLVLVTDVNFLRVWLMTRVVITQVGATLPNLIKRAETFQKGVRIMMIANKGTFKPGFLRREDVGLEKYYDTKYKSSITPINQNQMDQQQARAIWINGSKPWNVAVWESTTFSIYRALLPMMMDMLVDISLRANNFARQNALFDSSPEFALPGFQEFNLVLSRQEVEGHPEWVGGSVVKYVVTPRSPDQQPQETQPALANQQVGTQPLANQNVPADQGIPDQVITAG
ncbi:hypothetical protein ABW19_dt0208587 [Dactylella cylindrospora]|nr:hypothetical protein ABW19_dt0208587 [Dactylella cylindrospora]